MNEMEELMAGLFGDTAAPGAEDPRRRADFAGGSVAGANIFVQRLMPYLMGAPGIIRGGRFGPGGAPGQGQPPMNGLAALLSGLNPIGGPNAAPGNTQTGSAVYQPPSPGEGFLGGGPGAASYTGAPAGPSRYTSLPGLNARLGGMR